MVSHRVYTCQPLFEIFSCPSTQGAGTEGQLPCSPLKAVWSVCPVPPVNAPLLHRQEPIARVVFKTRQWSQVWFDPPHLHGARSRFPIQVRRVGAVHESLEHDTYMPSHLRRWNIGRGTFSFNPLDGFQQFLRRLYTVKKSHNSPRARKKPGNQ